jgi:beta-glucosidase
MTARRLILVGLPDEPRVRKGGPVIHSTDFANDFLWGTATAAYQIEGGVTVDNRGPSIWDTFAHSRGKIWQNENGDIACDHYHRWQEDIALMRELGVNAYRFSIAWPRIIPQGRGVVNQKGLDHYDRLVDALIAAGITPFATLYHWDLPQALQDEGGWAERSTIDAFLAYTDVVSQRLGDRIPYWVTHNEPSVHGFHGHYYGVHAPGLQQLPVAMQTMHHLLLSHGYAVPIIRAANKDARVGIALNFVHCVPADDSPASQDATRRHDGQWNRWCLEPLVYGTYPQDVWELLGNAVPVVREGDLSVIQTPIDFLGVNYYFRARIQHDPAALPFATREAPPLPDRDYTACGWEVYPDGLRLLLERLHRDYPVPAYYITESGAAFDDVVTPDQQVRDGARQAYLEAHFRAAHQAAQAGVPLRGYFVWSLLDNFEWGEGYSKRFGIVHVDFATQRRTIKESGRWFQRWLKEQAAEPAVGRTVTGVK